MSYLGGGRLSYRERERERETELSRERERERMNLECCSRVLDEQLLAGAAGEVACPVGTGRDGVGVEVVALHRPRQVGSVHVMHVAAGGRVQQVHLAARPLLQEDKFNVHP